MALFDDEHTDAKMRRTIPQFALLGSVAVAASVPFVIPTVERRMVVLAITAAAALSAPALRFRDIISRITHAGLFALLCGYCALITVAVGASDEPATPYRFVYLVPVLFGAVFFTGPIRYGLAVIAPLMAHIPLDRDWEHTAVAVAMFLFVAHFGAVVSDTLRDSLRSTRSLHTLLEAASGSPLRADLAAIGLDAVLEVVGWSSGVVFLAEGSDLRIVAFRATGPRQAAVEQFIADPLRIDDLSLLPAQVFSSRTPVFVPDIAAVRAEDNSLVRAGLRSMALLPLVHHDRSVGVVMIGDTAVHRVDDTMMRRLERVAAQLALALGSARAYREEAEASASLRELNRRKDEFLANVSHELRTPAATIKLVASTLRASSDRLSREQLDEMYSTLERRSQHLSELIENLLDEAVAEAGRTRLSVTSIDWRDAVVRWAEIAQLQTGRQINLHVPAGAVIGTGDAVKLERVVANLLSNAAKFSEPNTPIELSLRAEDSVIEVSVEDHGIGIAPQDAEHIFERFRQVEGGSTRSAGGFGIGLSLARHFVEAHGGSIVVSSTPGAGSSFTVRVPRTQAPASGAQGEMSRLHTD